MTTVEKIEAAYDGLDTDTAPDYLAKTKAPVLDNFLVDRPGMLPMRGPILDAISLYTGDLVGKPVGIWAYNNRLLVGLKANSTSAVRDPWVAPYRRTSTAGDLSTHYTSIYHVDLETRVATAVTSATAEVVPGPRSTRLGAYTYGISFSGLANETVNGGLQRRSQLCRWDGTAVLPTAIGTGFAPSCMQDVKAHLNRLFVLGGNVPGTTGAVKPNSLFWSDSGGPTAGTLVEWKDDVSALVNQIVIDNDDVADFGVALAKISAGLVIFKRRSIHTLTGLTPATFSVKTFSTDVGCIDPRSVVEYEGGVFFMSERGLMFFDGATLTNATENLRSSLVANAILMMGDAGVDGGQVVAGKMPNNYIGVSVGQSPATTASSSVSFSGLYHPPRTAWVGFTSSALSAERPIGYGNGLSRSYMVDDQALFASDAVTAPEVADESRRGNDEATTTFTFDGSGTGPLFNGTDDVLKNQITGTEAWTSVAYSAIPSRWHSRLARFAQPTNKAVAQRLMLDYRFIVNSTSDDANLGWYVSVIDGQGNELVSEFQVPSQGDPSTYAYRRQHVVDVFAECADAQLRVEWRGAQSFSTQDASVLGAYLEFEPAQQRRSS